MEEIVKSIEEETGQTAQATESGLRYVIIEAGDGPQPEATDTVVVHYELRLKDGSKVDSSYDRGQPATFPLNRVIPGWTEGVCLFNKGTKAKLVVPPDLGYGSQARPGLPANSVLIFDIHLIDIK
jgi:FKBP-type peptidyl-prolyl cis-trans isomerase FkpA